MLHRRAVDRATIVPAVASAWAPAASATIHPGVQTFTDGAQCTSNFVFSDGTNVYLGQAAHCSGTGGSTDTDGCTSGTLPVGTPVDVTGASKPGTLVYNSWTTMQANGESERRHLRVQRPRADQDRPGRRREGEPVGSRLRRAQRASARVGSLGAKVYSYGNSELRGGVTKLSPKEGVADPERGQRLEPQRASR